MCVRASSRARARVCVCVCVRVCVFACLHEHGCVLVLCLCQYLDDQIGLYHSGVFICLLAKKNAF